MITFFRDFFRLEAASGIILLVATACAITIANSPYVGEYQALLAPAAFWINDGLMTVFFLLIGLEIKRELIEGELSTRSGAALPVIAAMGGVVLPAIIYTAFNHGTEAMRGWAVPTATDIAFSLGILALFGSRLNASLKIFLMAVAIMDDLIAVIIIAVFYTSEISSVALAAAFACGAVLYLFNRRGMEHSFPYLLAGLAMWYATLQSGVHPTIAGVALGLLIPLKNDGEGLGENMIHVLHPWVAFLIMPLFAFANAGIPLSGLSRADMVGPAPVGIALGLFFGKQLGIFLAAWLMIRLKFARLPAGAGWLEFYAVCLVAGIGFTMSLFIGALAFEDNSLLHLSMRVGVIAGSLLSAICGYMLMWFAIGRKSGTT